MTVAGLDFQYRSMVFLGDVFRIKGQVTRKWRGKSGNSYVEAAFKSTNTFGEEVMPGTITYALPSRENGPVKFPVELADDSEV